MEAAMNKISILAVSFQERNRLIIFFMVIVVGFCSCKKMDDTYREYIEGGEIVYVSKADSVNAYPGHNRVLLTWLKGTDPKVSLVRVFDRNGKLLKEKNVDEGAIKQEVLLEEIPEGTHALGVVTVDDKGNTSVKVTVSATSFGQRYQSALQTRRVERAVYQGEYVQIDWYTPTAGAIATEVVYEDENGDEVVVVTPAGERRTILSDFAKKTQIKYRTLFMPSELAIDTFYSDYADIPLEYMLDKAKFKRWNTPDFPYTEYNIGRGYNIEKLWDEVYTEYGYIYLETQPLPRSFTFDLGQLAIIDRIRLSPNWSSQLYKNGNIKKAEIWGSATPDVSTDFSTWTYLGTLESVKPSGLPLGQTTAADLAYAQAGENFQLADNLPPVRYIRFVVQDTWSGSISMHITELTFWGDVIAP